MCEIQHIAIMICTRGRAAVRNDCIAATGMLLPAGNIMLSVIVGDNNTPPEQELIAQELAKTGLSYRIVHENRSGYCYIRNRVLEAALASGADTFVFIDDDHAVEPELIQKYVEAFQIFDADVVHGSYVGSKRNYEDGQRAKKVATYNVAFRKRLIAEAAVGGLGLRFDTRLNLTGREDVEFFRAAEAKGARLIYAGDPKTRLIEAEPGARAPAPVPLTVAYAEGSNAIYVERLLHDFTSALRLFMKSYALKAITGFFTGLTGSGKGWWNFTVACGAFTGLWATGVERPAAKQGRIVPLGSAYKSST